MKLFPLFSASKRAQGCKDSTLRAYELDLKAFFRFVEAREGRKPKWRDLCAPMVEAWCNCQLSDAAKARRIACLKSFSAWLQVSKHTKIDLLADLKAPRLYYPIVEYLTYSEYELVVKFIRDGESKKEIWPGRDMAILALFMNSGIRLAELINLEAKNVNLTEGFVQVKRKGGKIQQLPLGDLAWEALQTWEIYRKSLDLPAAFPYFFVSNRRQKLSTETVRDIVKKWLERAGITKAVTPHGLRHSFATYQIKKGTPLPVLQRLLGHSQINTTSRYLHFLDEDLRKAVNHV